MGCGGLVEEGGGGGGRGTGRMVRSLQLFSCTDYKHNNNNNNNNNDRAFLIQILKHFVNNCKQEWRSLFKSRHMQQEMTIV